jgi:hypothetical protein
VSLPYWLAPAALAVLALALRLYNIGHESLWLDEGYTLLFSRLPFPRLFLVGGAHEHPPLYYLLVHLTLGVHDSSLVPRVISAFAGSLSVLVLAALGTRLFGRRAGLIAAGLLVVAPFQVWYSQDGRGYELAGLAVLLSYWALLRAFDRRRTLDWTLYAACTAACLYAEYTTVFVMLPQIIFLARARREGLVRPLVLSLVGAALLFAPWLGVVAGDAAGIAADYWIPSPTPQAFAATVLEFLGLLTPCPSPPCQGHELAQPLLAGQEVAVALAISGVVVALAAAAIAMRRVRLTVLSLWLILPFAIVLLLAVRRSLYLDRVFLDATFALYLLIGWAATRAGRRKAIGILLALALAVASIANLAPIYAGGVNPDWKSAARDFAAAYRPGQAVFFNPGVLASLVRAYLPTGWTPTKEVDLWSRSYLDVPGWQGRFPQPANPDKRELMRIEATIRNYQLSLVAAGRRDVWLITYDYSGMNDTRRWFTIHGFQPLLSEEYDGDTRIELWSRAGPEILGPAAVPDTGFRTGWTFTGRIVRSGDAVQVSGPTELRTSFAVTGGQTYSVGVQYRGFPPASKPAITATVLDASGRTLSVLPRTQWYDWPVNGVWLSQPFGFVVPPGGTRVVLSLRTAWGTAEWRHVAVYRER